MLSVPFLLMVSSISCWIVCCLFIMEISFLTYWRRISRWNDVCRNKCISRIRIKCKLFTQVPLEDIVKIHGFNMFHGTNDVAPK